MELIGLLTQNLGIESKQAEGGVGLLLKMAKDKLGDQDFSKVAESIPGAEGLMGGAPSGGVMGALGGLTSKLGGGGDLAALAGLAGGFKGLGLDSGMIGKFVPIILSFVQSKGGDAVKGLLEGAFK
jgi:hypothetical protein